MNKLYALVDSSNEDDILFKSERRNEIANQRDFINDNKIKNRAGELVKVRSILFLGRVQIADDGHLVDTLKNEIEEEGE